MSGPIEGQLSKSSTSMLSTTVHIDPVTASLKQFWELLTRMTHLCQWKKKMQVDSSMGDSYAIPLPGTRHERWRSRRKCAHSIFSVSQPQRWLKYSYIHLKCLTNHRRKREQRKRVGNVQEREARKPMKKTRPSNITSMDARSASKLRTRGSPVLKRNSTRYYLYFLSWKT